MYFQITDKNNNTVMIKREEITGYWVSHELASNVIVKTEDETLTIPCKSELYAKSLVDAITEGMGYCVDNVCFIANLTSVMYEMHDKILKMVAKEEITNNLLNYKNAETAEMTGDVEIEYPKESDENIWFFLQDNVHAFKIGLSDVLSAVNFAEESGYVPALPKTWWEEIERLYPECFAYDNDKGRISSCESSRSDHPDTTSHTR